MQRKKIKNFENFNSNMNFNIKFNKVCKNQLLINKVQLNKQLFKKCKTI